MYKTKYQNEKKYILELKNKISELKKQMTHTKDILDVKITGISKYSTAVMIDMKT